jgi:hypothetical protein
MRGVPRRRLQPLALPPAVRGRGSEGEALRCNGGARRRGDPRGSPGDGLGVPPLFSGWAGPGLGEGVVLGSQRRRQARARVRHATVSVFYQQAYLGIP